MNVLGLSVRLWITPQILRERGREKESLCFCSGGTYIKAQGGCFFGSKKHLKLLTSLEKILFCPDKFLDLDKYDPSREYIELIGFFVLSHRWGKTAFPDTSRKLNRGKGGREDGILLLLLTNA